MNILLTGGAGYNGPHTLNYTRLDIQLLWLSTTATALLSHLGELRT